MLWVWLRTAPLGDGLGSDLPLWPPDLGIGTALGLLFLAVGVIHGSELALDQPTRRRIYEHLLRVPGDHFLSITRSLHLSKGTASYHLAVLVRTGAIRTEKGGRKRRYFPLGRQSQEERNWLYTRSWGLLDLRTRVFLVVDREREVSPNSVGQKLGISRQLAAYHLERLADAGWVSRRRGRYVPTAEGREGLSRVLDPLAFPSEPSAHRAKK